MLFFKKKKEVDFIKNSESKLAKLTETSSNCLNSIVNMIFSLSETNNEINNTIEEIHEGINKLQETTINLEKQKNHNVEIIERFNKLIEE